MEEQGEVTHRFWAVSHADRIQVATAIVERSWPAIVFSRTRHGAERLSKQLNKAGVRSEAIHGDRSQSQRERALSDLRRGRVQVLVATDIASRGIDVKDITHIINFDVPTSSKAYLHRVGRTGRAGARGVAISLVNEVEARLIPRYEAELSIQLQLQWRLACINVSALHPHPHNNTIILDLLVSIVLDQIYLAIWPVAPTLFGV